MAWYDEPLNVPTYDVPPNTARTIEATQTSVIHSVFRHMALGLGVTGVTAIYAAQSESLLTIAFRNPYMLGIVQLALVFGLSLLINKLNAVTATAMFYAYSAVTGLTLAPIFIRYAHGSIATAFLVTAGSFATMAAYGYTTKRDLTGMGNLLFMALIGIVIASVANFFLHSSGLMWLVTYAGIVIFVGLTAYDTQRIKDMAYVVNSEEERRKVGILGALILYLDFINLFWMLLRALNRRNENDDE